MAKGELRLFAVKRLRTDQMLLVAWRAKFEAYEALAGKYPDEDADDFEFVPDSVLKLSPANSGAWLYSQTLSTRWGDKSWACRVMPIAGFPSVWR